MYLAADGSQLPSAEGADHRAEISLRDSVSGTMREYYPSGKMWRFIPYAHVARGIRHGVELTYSETGQLRRRQEFGAGQRQGELQLFAADGHLSRKVVFDHDKQVSQTCFTPAGLEKECKAEKVLPQYDGDMAGLVRAIEQATVMPNEELSRGLYGTVVLKFVVDAQAAIAGAVVMAAPTPGMAQAVETALTRIKPYGAPGQLNDEPIEVLYTLPIKVGNSAPGARLVHNTTAREYVASAVFLEEGKLVGSDGAAPVIGEMPNTPSSYNPTLGTSQGNSRQYPGSSSRQTQTYKISR